MTKVVNSNFTITIANIDKKPKKKNIYANTNISRKCLAVVTKINGEYKAIINYNNKTLQINNKSSLNGEQLILPFTEESFSLKGKTYVWLKNKDKYGHNVYIIRDCYKDNISPGIKEQYDVFKENVLIAGNIIRKNNKMYFNYTDLVAHNCHSEYKISNITVDDSKPLFNK